jgi:cyclase
MVHDSRVERFSGSTGGLITAAEAGHMTSKLAIVAVIVLVLQSVGASQAPSANQAENTGTLRQIVPGHYVYVTTNEGRLFNSGVVATSEGVLVFDALGSDAIARAQRQAIAAVVKQPIRYLVSSPFHDPYSKGNLAYADVFKIGHENYRVGLIDQMQRGRLSDDEQRARMPDATFRDRMTLHLGGKEIQVLHFGNAHTKGDSILFVPQDRIAYMSEVFFNEEFPNMGGGYGVSWIRVLDAVKALDADIFIPGHGPIPEDPKQTRAALDRAQQILVDARDGIQNEIARGATEDQAVAAVRLQQYEKLPSFAGQREVVLRRIYRELKGTLQ